MAESITDQPINLFNPDGSLNADETVIEYLKSTSEDQAKEMYNDLSFSQLKKLLGEYRNLRVILTKKQYASGKNSTLRLNSSQLREIAFLIGAVEHGIKIMDERRLSLQAAERGEEQATLQTFMGINRESKKAPQEPQASIADMALIAAGKHNPGSDAKVAEAGDTVTIKFINSGLAGKEYKLTLVSSQDDNSPQDGKYYIGFSFGCAIYGHRKGDQISCQFTNQLGIPFELKAFIIGIEKAQIFGGHVMVHNKN